MTDAEMQMDLDLAEAQAKAKAKAGKSMHAPAVDNSALPDMAPAAAPNRFESMSGPQQFMEGVKKEGADIAGQAGMIYQQGKRLLTPATSYETDAQGNMIGLKPEATSALEQAKTKLAETMQKYSGVTDTTAGATGNFLAKALPLAAATVFPPARTLAGATLLGAGHEALHADASPASIAMSGLAGGVGSAVGAAPRVLTQGVKNTLNPTQQEIVDLAQQQGYKLLPSQATGNSKLKLLESTLQNNMFSGGRISATNEFNTRLSNEAALKSIGIGGQYVSPEALAGADAIIGSRFDAVRGVPKFRLGDDFKGELQDALKRYSTVKEKDDAALKEIDDWMTGKNVPFAKPMLKGSSPAGYTTSGEVLVDARSALSRKAHDLYSAGDNRTAKLYEDLVDAIDTSIEKGLPQKDLPAFSETRDMYRNKLAVEKAYDPKSPGNLNMNKLSQALATGRKKATLYAAGGDDPLVDVTRIEQQLKNRTPDSFTAERNQILNTPNIIGTLIGGLVGMGSGGLTTAASAAAGLTLPKLAEIGLTSRSGLKLLTGQYAKGVPNWAWNALRGATQSGATASTESLSR
jgi:hypothetical protein